MQFSASILTLALVASVSAHGKIAVATGDAGGNGTALGSKYSLYASVSTQSLTRLLQSKVVLSQVQVRTRSLSQIPPFSRVKTPTVVGRPRVSVVRPCRSLCLLLTIE